MHKGGASSEYQDAQEFFQRTYITDGLRRLLANALIRLSGQGGDPVVELKTNFGGGKTHSMLALYHLCSCADISKLSGMEDLIRETNTPFLEKIHAAVLVGSSLSPGQSNKKEDGVVVRTLWGELAWQLGRKEGYKYIAEADQNGVSPGADSLEKLFANFSPCLILIDEWVAYVRQVYNKDNLPAGSFDANFTFAQSLTEAVKRVPRALLLASIPSSDIEIGGEGGYAALERLQHVFNRIAVSWHPANMEEGFEIVRRRLFQPMRDSKSFIERDAVIKTIMQFYRDQGSEFPSDVKEADYTERMREAYPIHPELFDRLYGGWSTLDKFQRTRGVLQLMAAVIHTLWERNDNAPLIYPASIPIDDGVIRDKLTYYLEDPWIPVIEKDVDGPNSLPLKLDQENPSLGRYSACRRVARTIYMGSAPTLKTSQKGIDERYIKLGCVLPGESVATFGDALRRLSDNAAHLYVDKQRFWYSTQPSVLRMAQDRAASIEEHAVLDEIKKRIRQDRSRGVFDKIHPIPESTLDVPDEMEARLVILGPEYAHTKGNEQSPGRSRAEEIVNQRGNSPRIYRNTLVFLAADHARLSELIEAVQYYLSWESILNDKDDLNLDTFSQNQAVTKKEQAHEAIQSRIIETYCWLLTPSQPELTGKVVWNEHRLQGGDAIVNRASKKLINDESLYEMISPTHIRIELDRCLWRDGNHVPVKKLWEYFASYLYLPRLKDSNTLLRAIEKGISDLIWVDCFAYAEAWDEQNQRYLGLAAGSHRMVVMDGRSVLVKPDVVQKQFEDEERKQKERAGQRADTLSEGNVGGRKDNEKKGNIDAPSSPPKYRQFHGHIKLDATRITPTVSQIEDSILSHLKSDINNEVEVTLEIQARIPNGASEHLIRTVTENCRTL